MARELVSNAHRFLSDTGWTQVGSGSAGSLWAKERGREHLTLAVPQALQASSLEWGELVDRLSRIETQDPSTLARRISHFDIDVARIRAANDFVIDESIPLRAGFELLEGAFRMLRASATTARGPRGHIAGNFSVRGDDIVSRARLGHTERGSYIVPILVPLSLAPVEPNTIQFDQQTGIDRVQPEPSERRVTRTLAEALAAIDAHVVQPESEAKASALPGLIDAGASRELVLAIAEIVRQPAVAQLDVSFEWAGAAQAPERARAEVGIPAAAAPRLDRAARLLKATRRDPGQKVVGPIVEVRHLPGQYRGEIAVQTYRRGQLAEVRVELDPKTLDDAHEWMRGARTVVIEGQIDRVPGRPLRIRKPTLAYPLDETFLPDSADDSG